MEVQSANILSYAAPDKVFSCKRAGEEVRVTIPFMREELLIRMLRVFRILIILSWPFLPLLLTFVHTPIRILFRIGVIVLGINLLLELLIFCLRLIRPLQHNPRLEPSILQLDRAGLRCWNLKVEKYKAWNLKSLPEIKSAKRWFSRKACIKIVDHRIAVYLTAIADYEDVQSAVDEIHALIKWFHQPVISKMSP